MIRKSLGICIGASTISFVETHKKENRINVVSVKSLAHSGNPKKFLADYFNMLDCSGLSVVVTGRKFKQLINAFTVSEPEAIEEGIKFLKLCGHYDAIVSLGGENFMVYGLNQQGSITNVFTGNKCASGTGEFFLQQIRRMDMTITESLNLSNQKPPHHLSGRCSVFCKSDCTHALNKGVSKGEVVSGLCKMIADKIIELLAKQKSDRIIIIGGVSENNEVIKFLKDTYKNIYLPKEATYFEALGASLIGLNEKYELKKDDLFKSGTSHFTFLDPLNRSESRVTFKTLIKDEAKAGDICLVGLDVGSTTTKAVITRFDDNALLASVYLRTNGNPIQASIDCYKQLKQQVTQPIEIIGLGVTGSGRHIAGLHALTRGVINEIIAHASASAFFDEKVDTIFEIGGQDAKYTYLTNGVASDYAMNEACSAGTGSFLEESAKETLNTDYREIGDIALTANNPPNFNDQCAAFISSDIKNAVSEGILKEDIIAGLVYSVCMNYINRVKGNRTIGNKIFMQGGVCYNRAVPVAMSILINKDIVVPPEPGLMGAYGSAIEIKKRIGLGLLARQKFSFDDLINRRFTYKKEFICNGGKEKCDRKCPIAVIEVEDKKYLFGGACNKYYNQRFDIMIDQEKNDYVSKRQHLVFEKYVSLPQASGKVIGIPKSFLTNTLYPLYYNFFTKLGFCVILSDEVDFGGINKIRSAFCYPVEIAHCLFQNLLKKHPDYIFLPHITRMHNHKKNGLKRTCVFVQGESYYLKSAFSEEKLPKIISPVIDFSQPKKKVMKVFIDIAKGLGKKSKEAKDAFNYADEMLTAMVNEFHKLGQQALKELEADKNKFGMVLFGRPYNAFTKEANFGIPKKFASKDIIVIPHDLLPCETLPSYEHMYWYLGQQILQAARFVRNHKQLFGVYLTNFSCGPDSFIISYFRKIMGTKPSLTLELDNHSADVGIDTRIDAAIDIIRNYRELEKKSPTKKTVNNFKPLQIIYDNYPRGHKQKVVILDSFDRKYSLDSPDVEVIIPSMSKFGTQALAAAFIASGINAKPLPVPTIKTLKYGRSHTSCKECLPFILTTGSLIEYIKEEDWEGKKVLFFMPSSSGPCRQGQYLIKLKDIIEELKLKNVGLLTLDDSNSYRGLGNRFYILGWISVVISDILQDIENVILGLAIDSDLGLKLLNEQWNDVVEKIKEGKLSKIFKQLKIMSDQLSKIELKQPLKQAKIISLVGEVFVRREEFSRLDLIKTLAKNGFIVRTAPVSEYIYYCNYISKKRHIGDNISLKEKIKVTLHNKLQEILEKKIKTILSKSGLVQSHLIDVEKTIAHADHLISDELLGETILTTGMALREIIDESHGVISIGPFICMPSRLSEALLSKEMTLEGKIKSYKVKRYNYPEGITSLPFLHIETDGNPYPQIIQSKLEIFMLQAEKLHRELNKQHIPKTNIQYQLNNIFNPLVMLGFLTLDKFNIFK